jgi:hypothetical protein
MISTTKIIQLAIVSAFVLPISGQALDFSKDCIEVKTVDINVRDEVRAGEPMNAVRTRVLLMASQSALRQTIGERVSAKSSLEMQSQNSVVDERLYNRIRAQAAGFVKQQDVQEKTEVENGRDWLVMTTTAAVCVPKPSVTIKETLFIGQTTNIQGQNLPEFRLSLQDIFSNSPMFTVVETTEDEPDIQVSGKIDRIQWGDINKSTPPGFLGDAKITTAPSDFQRLSVGVTLQARREDGSVVTATVSQYRNFPPSADPANVAEPYVREVLRQGGKQLLEKIANTRGEAPGAPTRPVAAPRSKEW